MRTFASILIVAGLAGGPAFATCVYPKAPTNIPDGSTATLKQMLAGMATLRTYNSQIKAYTDCLKLEHDATLAKSDPAKMSADEKKAYAKQKAELDNILIQKNDAAVDEATAVTKRFNAQVEIYKAKHKKN